MPDEDEFVEPPLDDEDDDTDAGHPVDGSGTVGDEQED